MQSPRQPPGEPSDLDALFAQATAHHRAGRLAEAAAGFRQVLARQANLPDVQNYLGIVLCQQGQFDEALVRFERAIELNPRLADAHNNLANVLWQQRRLDDAVVRYRKAVAIKPDFVEAHNNLGSVLAQQGQFELAAARFEKTIALRPDHAGAHQNLANVLRHQGRLEQAAAHYEKALALKPDLAEACNNLGSVLWQQGRLDEAALRYRQALVLDPRRAEAHSNLALVLTRQEKHDEAAARFQQAIALKPDFADAHNGLGYLLSWQGKLDEAVAAYERALAIAPNHFEALSNLAATLRELRRLDESQRVFQRMLAFKPDSPQAQLGLATCHLLVGDYQQGWPLYEARLRLPDHAPQPRLRRWQGEPLAGRRLLLLGEQGLGDTIQFLRYAREFKALGVHVVLAVPAALGRLLAAGGDWDELFQIGPAAELPACDFYLPLASAPGALGTDAATIPTSAAYLSADPELTERWRLELAGIEGFKIGIAWQGARGFSLDRWRSIPLRHFAPLARLPGVQLISLQKGFGSEQIATVDFPIVDWSERLDTAAGPLMDTAAVMRNLDLVVAPDTATAHLAGALGAPVWIALQPVPDWRWLLDRDDSPWYPTARLFRQQALGQWPAVFQRIAQAVEQLRSSAAHREGQP